MAAGIAGVPADCRCFMVKRIFKRIFVFAVIACLLFACVPSVAFADVVEFQEAAKLGATIVDLYGSVNNTSLAYDALTDGSALTVIENLYQNYSTSASDPYTLAAIGAAAAAAGAIAVVYDAITGKGYVQLYQTQYIESLDGFWDYTLSDLGLLRNNDDLFEYPIVNGDVEPVQVYYDPGPFIVVPVLESANDVISDGLIVASSSGANLLAGVNRSGVYVCSYVDGALVYYMCLRSSSSFTAYFKNGTNNTQTVNSSSDSGIYRASSSVLTSASFQSLVPSYSSKAEAISTFKQYASQLANWQAASVYCYPEFYVGDPLTAQPTITIPDPASPQYVPSPSRINTDIEWLPEWGDPLPDGVSDPVPGVPYPVTDPAILNEAVPEIWQSVVQGVQTDPGSDPDPDPDPEPGPSPSEVFTPLLPVTLPSFNFSFSGIWHYVREWVSSLGAWFTTLFSIWSALPYAMVVPVYATAVVVIVLGVYKRFFM